MRLNRAKIVPPAAIVPVKNPASFYEFKYTTPAAIAQLETHFSTESMDITRRRAAAGDGAALLP